MSADEFVTFVQNDILTNPNFAKHLSNDAASQLDRLSNFTNPAKVHAARTISDLSSILEIDESSVRDLLILHGAKNPTDALTLAEVINFIQNDIYNSDYASELLSAMRSKISAVAPFANKSFLNTEMDASGLARTFGLDESAVSRLLFYHEYITRDDTDLTMSVADLLTLISTDETLKAQLSGNAMLSALLQNPAIVSQLASIPGTYDYTTMSTVFTNAIKNYATSVFTANPTATIAGLTAPEFMAASSNLEATLPATLKSIYVYRADQLAAATATMSPYDFVNFILSHASDEALSGAIDNSAIATLIDLKRIMDAVESETRFNATSLAEFLGADANSIKLLYSYYHYLHVNPNPTLSLYDTIKFIISDVIPSDKYSSRLSADAKSKVANVNTVIDHATNPYDHTGLFALLSPLSQTLESKTIDVAYIYHGSLTAYDDNWTMTVEQFVNYLNDNILNDARLADLIDDTKKADITKAKDTIKDAKRMLVGTKYSRAIFNTTLDPEGDETFNFIRTLKSTFGENDATKFYVIGDSPMALEMSESFGREMDFITILTMAAIFVVVAVTFRSILIPLVLVLIIQTAVWVTMAVVSFTGEPLYFISLIIVQSILMGATIDYAILYTSYYLENRRAGKSIKDALTLSYSGSIHTILCSASVLIIVTAIVGNLASAIAAKICTTISQGTLFSSILILVILPALLAAMDKLIVKKRH